MPLFANLTAEEINGLDRDETLVVLPTGCTEQQGPHLTVDFDTWFASELCEAAADRLSPRLTVLVLPATPYGPAPEHRAFGGFVDLRQTTFENLLEDVLDSLVAQRFRRLVIWRGCGGHQLTAFVNRFNATSSDIARLWMPEHPYNEIWCQVADPSVPGGHADSFTTSIALHRHPERVRAGRIPESEGNAPAVEDAENEWSVDHPTGVVGDASHATAELGALLWERTVDRVCETLADLTVAPVWARNARPTGG